MRFKDSEYTGGHVIGEAPDFPIVIEENFTFYNVDPDDGLMTGIFLDQKKQEITSFCKRERYTKFI